MKKTTLLGQLTLTASLLIFNHAASAAIKPCTFPFIDNQRGDTQTCKRWLIGNKTANNYGELIQDAGIFTVNGTLNNHGLIDIRYEFFVMGASLLDNKATGIINSSDWFRIYDTSRLDNYGTFNFIPRFGNAGTAFDDNQFYLEGTFNNYGVCRIDDNMKTVDGNGTINNSGTFEVTPRGKFKPFGDDLANTIIDGLPIYVQTAGETKVNGFFAVSSIDIQGGILSGSGTVVSNFDNIIPSKATLSPGSPLGTLTLTADNNDVICVGCSTDIEIAGASNADHLHVNGSLYLNNWKLNVQLRNGYIPPAGTSFNIISADLTSYYGPAPTYNLPKLPAGRTWSVNNTGTTITLTAN
ncbi:MAG: hypothetical protein ABL919_08730 [Methylococcales bacterium]|nr:hypothetical protein [Methylococcaceae bacterium]